jgi:hypothetical protein
MVWHKRWMRSVTRLQYVISILLGTGTDSPLRTCTPRSRAMLTYNIGCDWFVMGHRIVALQASFLLEGPHCWIELSCRARRQLPMAF